MMVCQAVGIVSSARDPILLQQFNTTIFELVVKSRWIITKKAVLLHCLQRMKRMPYVM